MAHKEDIDGELGEIEVFLLLFLFYPFLGEGELFELEI